MTTEYQNVSGHYLGTRGKAYFQGGFGSDKYEGRLLQADYFRPFCGDDLVLLDFGCADGLFLRNLPARRRIGVEANAAALDRCREICRQEDCSIELHPSLENVKEASVDLLISNHCLEHVPNPFGALLGMLKVLKPGGRLVLILPFDDWRASEHREWRPGDLANHLYTWSPLNIGNLLTDAGFVVDWAKLITSAWSPKFMRLRRFVPPPVFSGICRAFAQLRHRRQVFCLAHKLAPKRGPN
jgi:SAM-dependent methyltransferase